MSSGAGIPIIGNTTLSGAQTISLHLVDYVVEHEIPSREGGIVEREGSKAGRIDIVGIAVDSGADIQVTNIQALNKTVNNLVIPSIESGYNFLGPTPVFVERVVTNQMQGTSYPFYQWRLSLVARGPILGLSSQQVYTSGTHYNVVVATSGGAALTAASLSGMFIEVQSSGVGTVAISSGGVIPISEASGAVGLSGLQGVSISGSVTVITSGVNQITVSASGGVTLQMEAASTPNLRVSVWGGTTQANAGGFGNADTNSPTNGSLLVSPYNMVYDAGSNQWAREKSAPSTSGTTGVSVLSVGPSALEPDGNFYPIKATSGALNVSTSGTGAVTIAVSGGLVLQAGDTGANTNLRVSIWNGTQQVGTGNMTADANAAGDLDLKTESRTALFNGSSWDRGRSVAPVSGTTGTGLAAVGPMALAPDGNFYPLKTNSGALNVNISGGSITITGTTVSGGVTISGLVGISGGAAGLSGLNVIATITTNVSGNAVLLNGYDFSGASQQKVGVIASGAPILRVGQIWSYARMDTGSLSGVQFVTSGYTILHAIVIDSIASGGTLQVRDGISGDFNGSFIMRGGNNGGGMLGVVGPTEIIYDVTVLSGLTYNGLSGYLAYSVALYKQLPW